jgi:3'(2'), 5'-bisphosphate nucleotidase
MNEKIPDTYSDLKALLECALMAAQLAGEEILDVYSSNLINVIEKSDGSPITNADLRANNRIVHLLANTNIPILSEEAITPFEKRKNWERYWLVDPLDGTKDFLEKNDEFTVNIALISNGAPIIGVVAAPALKKVWYASHGGGAWVNNMGTKTRINALLPWPHEPRMFTSCFHNTPSSLEFAHLNGIVHSIPAGAASKLARVAASEAEFYPRFAGTSEWDIAAGDAILREAGGFMRDVSGEILTYNKISLRNPFFIVWRPPISWDDIKLPYLF